MNRLERELVSAGRRDRARTASPSAQHSRRSRRRGWMPVIVSLAVTTGVVIIVGTGLFSGSSTRAGHHAEPTPTTLRGPTSTKVTAVGACRHQSGGRLPALVMSDAAPGRRLAGILSIARQPASADGATMAIQGFDRYPLDVLTVFRRFVRIVDGERGVRVAFFPVTFCQQTASGRGFPPPRLRIAPAQAIVMLPLQGRQKTLAVEASTPSMIVDGSALPGLDRANNGGWIQAVIVPDGVAKVAMQFTPPFLHHYTVTAAIHHNVAVVVRYPDYTPTIVRWYAADGHLLHTYVDQAALRYDTCLAHHRKHCPS